MFYAQRLKYLARAFVDAHGLLLSAAERQELHQKLRVPDLQPMPGVEIGPNGQFERAGFVSPTLDLTILFRGESIDVAMGGAEGGEPQDFAKFALLAASALETSAAYIGRSPHRLALVQEGLLGEMSEEAMTRVGMRLLSPPAELGAPPFEWTWRCACHRTVDVAGSDELLNEITSVKRLSGLLTRPASSQATPFDRLQIDLDVNTSPTNTRGRFDQSRILGFFEVAVKRHGAIAEVATALAEP